MIMKLWDFLTRKKNKKEISALETKCEEVKLDTLKSKSKYRVRKLHNIDFLESLDQFEQRLLEKTVSNE